VGNAGTAARFIAALVCLGHGVYRLQGVPRMHERPQVALFEALRQLGYQVDSENDKLPAVIHGTGPRSGSTWVSITQSSQFASALLLCSETGGWEVHCAGENEEESPYVAMTAKVIEAFPKSGGTFQIEPDASGGSYFLAAGWSGDCRLRRADCRGWPNPLLLEQLADSSCRPMAVKWSLLSPVASLHIGIGALRPFWFAPAEGSPC
jgi:3-phosphoshikimate 1-carboxyvinyltransferase